MEFKDFLNDYSKAREKLEKERKALAKAEQKVEWHKKREKKLWLSCSPFDQILIPLCKEICKRKGFKYFDIYGPFGLTCETSLYFSNKGRKVNPRHEKMNSIDICKVDTWGITLTPSKNTESGYKYWNGETTNQYKEGSIGWLNGENNVYVPLPADVDEIIKLLEFNKGKEDE